MEKAIEIKRRAQRCVQNGDLDGALNEYEKLVASDDTDPYNFVLLADLLYKKGDSSAATQRYLSAATAYEKAGLYKNGIAVCKKMMRLSLSQSPVLLRLAVLHELDGIATEAALYYMQYAENLVRDDKLEDASTSFRKAFDTCPENVKALEREAEVNVLVGNKPRAAEVLVEAAGHYQRAGQLQDADRCRNRAAQVAPSVAAATAASAPIESGPAGLPEAMAIEPTATWVAQDDSVAGPEPTPRALPGTPVLERASEPEMAPVSESGPPRLGSDSFAADFPSDEDERVPAGPPRLETSPAPQSTSIETAVDNDEIEILPSVGGDEEEADGVIVIEDDDTVHQGVNGAAPLADAAPGLRFDAPAPAPQPAPELEPVAQAADEGSAGLQRVERLLASAQQHFRSGNREAAGVALADAAREYDGIGQHDSAATIYRSLGKSAHASVEVMMLWIANCERREDRVEAAQVACELGDRALNDGNADDARGWFERARAFDGNNALAQRRLQRLVAPAGEAAVATDLAAPTAAAPVAAGPASSNEVGRVEVAVGRGEAVTFDLSSLVSEFQRGVEMQLSGDAQGHYDLGMAYREMGLLEQAVEAFTTAGREPSFRFRCTEMVGRCLLDQGRFDEAAQEFVSGLAAADVTPEQAADLRYQLGLAHEAAGRTADALAEFESVYALQSNYPDVALKIRVLRKALESR